MLIPTGATVEFLNSTRARTRTSWNGRLRGARRMTATTENVPTDPSPDPSTPPPPTPSVRPIPPADAGGLQKPTSMPLGSTTTSTPGPAMWRIGSAAASLTAENTTGHRDHPHRRLSRANSGAA